MQHSCKMNVKHTRTTSSVWTMDRRNEMASFSSNYLLDETPPPLDTAERGTNGLVGVGLLGDKGRGMDLQHLCFQLGGFAQLALLLKL